MAKLGFSIYPEAHTIETSSQYLEMMYKYGANRIFMSLLQLAKGDQETFEKYKVIIAHANKLNMKVIADISPGFIQQQGWKGQLIDKAKEFGLVGLRLDEALPIEEIVELTNNPYNIKIEINMSTDEKLLKELLAQPINKDNLIGCHNFYPHKFTGLSYEHFEKMSELFHEHGIETAAFVSAHSADEGPWPVSEGLSTIEDHRLQAIDLQARYFNATGWIDNIIIANQFISEEELKKLADVVNEEVLTLPMIVTENLSETEEKIIAYDHVYRGDISAYLIRSSMPRIVYGQESIAPRHQSKKVIRGSIIIDNDLYTRYKGELQIALKSFEVSEKANVVGHISPEYVHLLKYLKAWQAFRLTIHNEVN